MMIDKWQQRFMHDLTKEFFDFVWFFCFGWCFFHNEYLIGCIGKQQNKNILKMMIRMDKKYISSRHKYNQYLTQNEMFLNNKNKTEKLVWQIIKLSSLQFCCFFCSVFVFWFLMMMMVVIHKWFHTHTSHFLDLVFGFFFFFFVLFCLMFFPVVVPIGTKQSNRKKSKCVRLSNKMYL